MVVLIFGKCKGTNIKPWLYACTRSTSSLHGSDRAHIHDLDAPAWRSHACIIMSFTHELMVHVSWPGLYSSSSSPVFLPFWPPLAPISMHTCGSSSHHRKHHSAVSLTNRSAWSCYPSPCCLPAQLRPLPLIAFSSILLPAQLTACQVVSCVLCFWSRNLDLIVMFLTAHLRSNNSPSYTLCVTLSPCSFPLFNWHCLCRRGKGMLFWMVGYDTSTISLLFFFTNLNGVLSTLSMFNAELYIVPPLVRQLILPKSQCLVLCLLSSHIYLPDSRLPGSWLPNSL